MKQIFEGFLSVRAKITKLINLNSYNKTEYNFNAPVTFIIKAKKNIRNKNDSLLPRQTKKLKSK